MHPHHLPPSTEIRRRQATSYSDQCASAGGSSAVSGCNCCGRVLLVYFCRLPAQAGSRCSRLPVLQKMPVVLSLWCLFFSVLIVAGVLGFSHFDRWKGVGCKIFINTHATARLPQEQPQSPPHCPCASWRSPADIMISRTRLKMHVTLCDVSESRPIFTAPLLKPTSP